MSKRVKRAAAAALMLLAVSPVASAAGLGRLTVLSALGQPFRAEVDLVSVKKDELSSLNARLASPDAFRQADLPYTAYVSNLKLSIDKRPNGDPYLRVTSSQPLNEPFIDFLVELYSGTGRLVRAYTALVDPPVIQEGTQAGATAEPDAMAAGSEAPSEIRPLPAPTEIQPRPPAPEVPATTVESPETETRAESPVPVQPEPMPLQREVAPPGGGTAAPAQPPAATDEGGGEYGPVKRGDTLSKIAREHLPADVTLDQMLVLLFRNNPDAFVGKNMNRLKTGKVIRLPEPGEFDSLTPQAARKEVRVQAANWNAYRERLAAMASGTEPADEAMDRTASGKVTTAVEEPGAPSKESPQDVLKLSKGEPARPGAAAATEPGAPSQARVRSLEEEVAAKGKEVREANDRIAQLEKQIKDMQALLEMKSKGMADLQKGAPKAEPPAAPEPAGKAEMPPAEPEPMVPPPSAGTPTAEEKPSEPAGDVVPPAGESGPGAEAPAPETAEPPPPPAKPKPKFVPPPPPPPPSLVDELLGNPMALGAGALIVAALGGLGFAAWKRKRGAKDASEGDGGQGGLQPLDADDAFGPAGFAGAGAASTLVEDSSEATIETTAAGGGGDESDALAEAEVFLIYGRDAQAEERLREAIAQTPQRYELHSKLLEIYAKRGDAEAFEDVARELEMGTGGRGELWEKAARLGYQIDPGNPRYASGRVEDDEGDRTMPGGDEDSTVQMPAFEDKSRDDLDFNLDFESTTTGSSTDIDLNELGSELAGASTTTTDIDLGLLGGSAEADDVFDPSKTMTLNESPLAASGMDTSQMEAFDPTATLAPPDTGDLPTLPGLSMSDEGKKAADEGIDFELGGNESTLSGTGTIDDVGFDLDTLKLDTPPLELPGSDDHEAGGIDADATVGSGDLDRTVGFPADMDATRPGSAGGTDLDLSSISLDLGDDSATVVPTGGKDEKWYDVQTKFDLAKAYQEMGDREGAREILEEVIAEGDAEQKSAAKNLLDELG